MELALARRRGEIAFRKRRIAVCGTASRLKPVAFSVSQSRPAARGWLARNAWRARSSSLSRETGSVKPIRAASRRKHFGVRLCFAERCDRRVVRERVQVSVRAVDVDLLELRGRRQQDVGVVGGVGLEDLVHDAEEIVARESRLHLRRFRRDGDGIRVVDVDRADRRVVRGEQRVADRAHVDRARRPADQIRPLERARIDGVGARDRQQRAARGIAPRAGERRQAGDRAHRVAAARMALQPVVQADRRRTRRRRTRARAPSPCPRRCRRCRRRGAAGTRRHARAAHRSRACSARCNRDRADPRRSARASCRARARRPCRE